MNAPAATAAPAASPAAPAWACSGAGAALPQHKRRIRLAMYLAFAALALAVAVQGLLTWQLEAVRAADLELLDRAGGQREAARRLGDHAAALLQISPPDPAQTVTLTALLDESLSQARQLDDLLDQQMARSDSAARHVRPALEAWQAVRTRLWTRAHSLLQRLDHPEPGAVHAAAAALRAEAAPAAAAATALSSRLRAAADERADHLRRDLALGAAALFVLLGLLSLLVVEPTARAVAQQLQQQVEQAAEAQRLALVAEHTNAMVLITDAADRIQWANAAFTEMTGWRLDEVVGQLPSTLLHAPTADPETIAHVRDALARGVGTRREWLNRTRDGHDLWLDVDLRPLRDGQGRLTGYISVSSDATARVMQQAKLQALWSALPAGVVVRSAEHGVVEANRTAERLLGMSLAQMQGRRPWDAGWRLVRDDLSDYPLRDHPALRALASGVAVRNETLGVRLPEGHLRWLLTNSEPLRDISGAVTGVVSCFSDITDRRVLQDQLSHHARTDALTQLPNRAAVMERLHSALAHASRHPGYGFALLFMDFDRFKQVNDTLGHAAGDELLRQIAKRLQLALRPGDALARLAPAEGARLDVAARIGGDEFVVVLEGVNNAASVSAIAERMLQDVCEPYLIGCSPVHTSASIGVVLHQAQAAARPDPAGTAGTAPTAEDVLRNADTAMYEAKRAGRGRWVMFDDSMHERATRMLAIESDLRRALERDELFVVYQPVLDLDRRSMTGVEALVRWRHPERGLVPPSDFIGVAEETGLIDAVGALVLRKSCTQFMRWRSTLGEQAPALLAVNLSRAQLKRAGMVEELGALLRDCSMQPQWLQLEVTESLAAQDESVQATLRQLKALGVQLALDDFGTGYSSLACLHQLPVDTVKVDRSFVQHAQTVEYHRVLIEATIRVARTLGMTTVAEGIETEGQAALMRELQCDRGQGFLFGHPMAAAALEDWARCTALAQA